MSVMEALRLRRTTESNLSAQHRRVVSALEAEEKLARKTRKIFHTIARDHRFIDNALRAYNRANHVLSYFTANIVIPELYKYDNMSCSLICEKMQEKFPREIRDIIYEQLVPPAYVDVDESTRRMPKPPQSTGNTSDDNRIWKKECLGRQTLRELSEHWYRTRTFVLYLSDDQTVKRFFDHSRWQLSFNPLKFITNVHVKCYAAQATASQSHNRRRQLITANVEKLAGLKEGARVDFFVENTIIEDVFNIEERLSAMDDGISNHDLIEGLFAPALRTLERNGIRVRAAAGTPLVAIAF